MIKKILLAVIGLAVMAAAAATAIVALAFALYAWLQPMLGAPGASAGVAGVAALLAAIVGVMLGSKARGRRPPPREATLVDKLGDFARDKPVIAAAGALAVGLIALKNPKLAAGLASAFMAGKTVDKAEKKSRRHW